MNPTTGQILDADIIFDADFLQFWKQEYETFTPESVALLTGGPLDLEEYRAEMRQHAGATCAIRTALAARATCWAACRGSSRSARR